MTHSQVLENTKLLRFSFADEILRNVDANGFDEAAWRMLQSVLSSLGTGAATATGKP